MGETNSKKDSELIKLNVNLIFFIVELGGGTKPFKILILTKHSI
jgi:hypothetical protein